MQHKFSLIAIGLFFTLSCQAYAKSPTIYVGCYTYCMQEDKTHAVIPTRVQTEKERLACQFQVQEICRPDENGKYPNRPETTQPVLTPLSQ